MKIAYCILCHRNTSVLRTLIELLVSDNDVYMHVDAKVDINDFREYLGYVNFIEKRENAAWGSFAAVNAIIKLLKATAEKKYDYIFLLSGDDLPLKSSDSIKKVLKFGYGLEYVGVTKDVNIDDRVKYLYPKSVYAKEKSIWTRARHKLRLYKKNPKFGSLPKLYKGCLWFTITSALRDYILKYVKDNPMYVEAFKKSLNADEVFFHTIICNSEFEKKIYMYETDVHDTLMCLRYIDWFTGKERPKILTAADYKSMKASDCLFARKISDDIDTEAFKKEFEL